MTSQVRFIIRSTEVGTFQSPLSPTFPNHSKWFCFKCDTLQAERIPVDHPQPRWLSYYHRSVICPGCWSAGPGMYIEPWLETRDGEEICLHWQPLLLMIAQFMFNSEVYVHAGSIPAPVLTEQGQPTMVGG